MVGAFVGVSPAGVRVKKNTRGTQCDRARTPAQRRSDRTVLSSAVADKLTWTAEVNFPKDTEVVDPLERHTKVICTIGPATCSYENLLRLAAEGMSMIRLNMSHGDYSFHKGVLDAIRRINDETPFIVGSIVDLGSLDMVRLGEFSSAPNLERGDQFTLTIRHEVEYDESTSEVSFDGFIDVAEVGDLIQVNDVVEMLVVSKSISDVVCEVTKGGELSSRAPIIVRGKSYGARTADAPPGDLDFAAKEGVDYVSLAFVESQAAVENVRKELRDRGSDAGIIAKIETPDALSEVEAIAQSADAVMVARGDLGTSIAYEKVPLWQERIVNVCRSVGKPVIVSTHFLDSMVTYPTPTRAEITDIFEAVRQQADALVLTAETASGRYPFKSLQALHTSARRMETQIREDTDIEVLPPLQGAADGSFRSVMSVAENISNTAAILANQRMAKAIVVFTQKGLMATLVSRCRPNAPVLAFTPSEKVQKRMTIAHGVRPFVLEFCNDPEQTIENAFAILTERRWVQKDDLVIIVADVLGGTAGAPELEQREAFDEISNGKENIPNGRVRSALRKLALKAPDDVEMMLARGGETVDFETFRGIADSAKQIVHTVQLRRCP